MTTRPNSDQRPSAAQSPPPCDSGSAAPPPPPRRRMSGLTVVGLVVTVIWTMGNLLLALFSWNELSGMKLNELGDFLAGAAAPLALLWLVVGYFQHGDELRLNTRVLKMQQEELKRQVSETATLAANSGRQAQAAELRAQLDTENQSREKKREEDKAQPFFVAVDGESSSDGDGRTRTTTVRNSGSIALDVTFITITAHRMNFPGIHTWEQNQKYPILLTEDPDGEENWPVVFLISYTDRLGNKRGQEIELWPAHRIRMRRLRHLEMGEKKKED